MLWNTDYLVNLNISNSESCLLYNFSILWNCSWLHTSLSFTLSYTIIIHNISFKYFVNDVVIEIFRFT
jgi:hypothetical protein